MATQKQIRISIVSALNAAGIQATKRQVNSMARHLKASMGEASKGMTRGWADFQAAAQMAIGAVTKAWGMFKSAVGSAFKFETQTAQFKTLIGNIDEAKAHMADLKALGDTPPFSLDEFAKASRELMVMSDGILGYRKSLELIGDAAAATGRPLETVSHAVGRLYAAIRDGQPLSRAVMELRNMGIITPAVAQSLSEMQDAGKTTAEIWDAVEQSLAKYNGAMAETEQTGDGLMAKLSTQWDNAVRTFGMAFQDTTKSGVRELSDALKELEDSGTIERWASSAGSALADVVKSLKWITDGISAVYNHLKEGRQAWKDMNASEVDKSNDWVMTREEEVNRYTKKRYYLNRYDSSEKVEEIIDQALEKEFKKREAEEKRLATMRSREEDELARKRRALADAQAKIDERNALQAAEKKAKADREAAERLRRDEEREAERMLREQERAARSLSMSAQGVVEDVRHPRHGGGVADAAMTDDGEYGALAREIDEQYRDVSNRRAAYQRAQYRNRQAKWDREHKNGLTFEERARGYADPYEPWNSSIKDAMAKWGAQLESLREQRRQLDENYGNGAYAGPTDAATRTANACEGILRHFDEGRI